MTTMGDQPIQSVSERPREPAMPPAPVCKCPCHPERVTLEPDDALTRSEALHIVLSAMRGDGTDTKINLSPLDVVMLAEWVAHGAIAPALLQTWTAAKR